MAVFDLPAGIGLRHPRLWLEQVTAGEPGLDGRAQVVFAESRQWVGQLVLPPLPQSLAMRLLAFGDDLRGRVGVLRVTLPNLGTPVFEGSAAAFLAEHGLEPGAAVPFDGGAGFEGGAGFGAPDGAEPVTLAAAAAGTSWITLDGYLGRVLAVGAYFARDEFLYRVAENIDGKIRFNPPLRTAVPAGARVEVSRPRVRLRLAKDDGLRAALDYGRWSGETTLDVIEAWDR